MIRTFNFVPWAQRDKQLREDLDSALNSKNECEVHHHNHRLHFYPEKKTVTITPISADPKLNPKEITYRALGLMLDNKWELIDPDEIKDI